MKTAFAGEEGRLQPVSSSGTVLRFRRNRPGPDEAPFSEVDLGDFWLPSVPFTLRPTSFADHTGITDAIHNAISMYAGRMRITKTAHSVLASQVSIYAKVIEFAWLNGCFTLSALTRVHTDALARQLAAGGWYSALRIEERTTRLIEEISQEQVRRLLRTHNGVVQVVHADFVKMLGTCVTHRELGNAKTLLAEAAGITKLPHRFHPMRRQPVAMAGMSEAGLNQILGAVNTLFDPPRGDRLTFVPFPEPTRLSSELGLARARTPDIGPDDVAAILKVSFDCLDRTGEPLLAFCEEFLQRLDVRRRDRSALNHADRARVFHECSTKARLEVAAGAQLSGIQQETSAGLTLYALLEDLFSAAFIIIAFLNARRKDEIAGAGVGLYSDSLRLVDAELDLYECDFFIEKTHQCRVPFFVGNATVAAISLLSRLAKLALKYRQVIDGSGLDVLDVAHSIFLMPITGRNGKAQAYAFSARPGKAAERLIRKALGDKHVHIGAHVFRRAYALLFFYRYENSDLLALSQHLCHWDVSATRVYVTDPHGGTTPGKPFRRLTLEQRNALAHDSRDLDQHMAKVSAERFEILAREVIEGKARYSGGFAKLVQRFHQRHLSRIEYRALPAGDQADRLAGALVARGHKFAPMPHGNCVAVTNTRNAHAKCFSPALGTIDRAEASADTCATCPYHIATREHVRQLETLAAELAAGLNRTAAVTVMRNRAQAELRNLQRAISLHRARIGEEHA